MRVAIFYAAALACVLGVATTSHATPGTGGVDLVLNSSELQSAERTGPIELTLPAPQPVAAGQYVGPMWIEGVYAKPLHRLPRQVRRGMAKPVGPSVTVVQSIRLGAGAGPGIYARF